MTEEKKEEQTNTPYDALTKRLADHFGPELLAYLNQSGPFKSCEPVGGEVEITHRVSDRFWRVTEEIDSEEHTFLMHIEFESSYDPHIGRRLGLYGWGLFEKEGLPVQQLVWWVGKDPPSYWPSGQWHRQRTLEMAPKGEAVSWLQWREVWLPGGFEVKHFIEEAPAYLLPFAAKMKGMDKALLSRLYERILDADISESGRQDLLVMSIFFFATKPDKMATAMEVFDMASLEQNALAQHLFEKGRTEGRTERDRELALKMLAQGYELDAIVSLTDLTLEELQELQQNAIAEPK